MYLRNLKKAHKRDTNFVYFNNFYVIFNVSAWRRNVILSLFVYSMHVFIDKYQAIDFCLEVAI